MTRDLHAINRALEKRGISRAIKERIKRSGQEVLRRKQLMPEFEYESGLPISLHLERIVELLKSSQVVVVAGETGSGKTTQLPLACIKAGYGIAGMIGHTQPRRLAARSVAERVAEQLGTELGSLVAYAIRFTDRTSQDTMVKIMTDGILLNEIQRDRFLSNYECIILDEAHERSLNVDFLLAYLRTLLPKRPDLRVIITSATIDVASFSSHFNDAPVVLVEGRGHPVEIRYRPPVENLENTVQECLDEILDERAGGVRDVLMFLSGEREILEWARWLRRIYKDRFDLLPLYARLPSGEQRRIFKPGKQQRIILATNVAETSITVPNVRYVLDVGTARISRYSSRSKIQRLPVEAISQASAEQRAGRCGRVAPGVCFRLYSEEDFNGRYAYTDPEIRRSNLASVVLRMRVFRFGSIESFPLLDAPESSAVRDAERLLLELGAFEGDHVTRIGRTLAKIPLDPRLGRMLIEADRNRAIAEVIVIIAALTVQDPRIRPLDRREEADAAHARFKDSESDFIAILRLWKFLEPLRQSKTRREFNRILDLNFVSSNRYNEWRALCRQLALTCRHLNMRLNTVEASPDDVHRSILAGSLGFIGFKKGKTEYQGARDLKFYLFPGSVLANRRPKWLVAAEISETARTYARCVARVEPRWIEQTGAHLLKHEYFEPHWNQKRGQPMIFRSSKLYGLPITSGRSTPLGPIDSAQAQDIFVRNMLVHPDELVEEPFAIHNRKLIAQIDALQARERRADILVSEDRQADFFKETIPEWVYTRKDFWNWYRRASEAERKRLFMSESDLLAREDFCFSPSAFPGSLAIGDGSAKIKYRFAPGEPDDGVNLQVTLSQLRSVSQDLLEWLVPGFLEQKIEALLRSLPKQQRKLLAPIRERVTEITSALLSSETYRKGSLRQALNKQVRRFLGSELRETIWRISEIDPFLAINVQVVNTSGEVLDQGRDVERLKLDLLSEAERSVQQVDKSRFEATGLRRFPPQGFPCEVVLASAVGDVVGIPVLVDQGDSVDLVLDLKGHRRMDATHRGLSRLVVLHEASSSRFVRREALKETESLLHYARLGSKSQFLDNLLLASARYGVLSHFELPRTVSEWNAIMSQTRGSLVKQGLELIEQVRGILRLRTKVALLTEALTSVSYVEVKKDLSLHLCRLIGPEFLWETPPERLEDLERYLRGIEYRATHLQGRVKQEHSSMAVIRAWEERLAGICNVSEKTEEVIQLTRLVEEYRIGLFSQPVGTKERVSEKRLQKVFEPVEASLGIFQ